MSKPDYEGFAKEVFSLTGWPSSFDDVEGIDIFELAKKYNLVKEVAAGPWYTLNS